MIVSIATAVLPVWRSPNDQFALTAADRNERVDRFDAGLERLINRLAGNDARRNFLYGVIFFGFDTFFAIERNTERREYSADSLFPYRYRKQAARAFGTHAFAHTLQILENHHSHLPFLQVERYAQRAVFELNHLGCHNLRKAREAGDAVAHFQHGTDRSLGRDGFEMSDLLFEFLNEGIFHTFFVRFGD